MGKYTIQTDFLLIIQCIIIASCFITRRLHNAWLSLAWLILHYHNNNNYNEIIVICGILLGFSIMRLTRLARKVVISSTRLYIFNYHFSSAWFYIHFTNISASLLYI